MRPVRCSRLCRATILPEYNTPFNSQSRGISSVADDASSSSPPTFKSKGEEIRTTGPRGSPDYIPNKRGYAPNLPIPARKFSIPTVKKHGNPLNPARTAPKPKHSVPITSLKEEYQKQMREMRRGYVYWRYELSRQRFNHRKEARERPHPPPPRAFDPTFAEKMSTPSRSDQHVLEAQLFQRPTTKRERGAGFHSDVHQAILSKKRTQLINDYLALHHTSRHFITDPKDLDNLIARTFTDTFGSAAPYHPQSYDSMLRDMESLSNLSTSYARQMKDDMEREIMNVMFGTVADGKPGHDEVMREIKERFARAEKEREAAAVESAAKAVEDSAEIAETQSEETSTTESESAAAEAAAKAKAAELAKIEKAKILESLTFFDAPQPKEEDQAEKEARILRERYRAGKYDPIPSKSEDRSDSQSTASPEEPLSDSIMSAISEIVESSEEQQPPSIADQALAHQKATNPQVAAEQTIIAAARKKIQKSKEQDIFPELGSISIDDPSSVEYLVKRTAFEKRHPSGLARVSVDKAKWAEPTKGRLAANRGKKAAAAPEQVIEKGTSQTLDNGQEMGQEGAEMTEEKPVDIGITIDDSQRQQIEALQVKQRKKERGASPKK